MDKLWLCVCVSRNGYNCWIQCGGDLLIQQRCDVMCKRRLQKKYDRQRHQSRQGRRKQTRALTVCTCDLPSLLFRPLCECNPACSAVLFSAAKSVQARVASYCYIAIATSLLLLLSLKVKYGSPRIALWDATLRVVLSLCKMQSLVHHYSGQCTHVA